MAAARSRSSLSLFRLVWIVRKRQPDEKFFPTCFLLLLYYFQFSCLLFLYGWLFSFLDFSFSFLLAFALTGKECAIPTNQMKTCRFISTMWPLTCFFFSTMESNQPIADCNLLLKCSLIFTLNSGIDFEPCHVDSDWWTADMRGVRGYLLLHMLTINDEQPLQLVTTSLKAKRKKKR